jgi:hypothetical protein
MKGKMKFYPITADGIIESRSIGTTMWGFSSIPRFRRHWETWPDEMKQTVGRKTVDVSIDKLNKVTPLNIGLLPIWIWAPIKDWKPIKKQIKVSNILRIEEGKKSKGFKRNSGRGESQWNTKTRRDLASSFIDVGITFKVICVSLCLTENTMRLFTHMDSFQLFAI